MGNEIQEYNQRFKRIWTLYIYPFQKIDLFGAKMYAVTYFEVRRSRMLWVVSSLIFHVEPLWNIISKSEIRKSEWQGYIMMHITKIAYLFLIV